MTDLDLVAVRAAAEKFQAVASDDGSTASEYIQSYNAYVEAVGVDVVIQLVDLAESSSIKGRAVLAEAAKLRNIHVLVEEKPLNSMTREEKLLALGFLGVTGLPEDEYAERRIIEYAKWLEHRAFQIDFGI